MNKARDGFNECETTGGVIRSEVFEWYYQIGLFDMKSVDPLLFASAIECYTLIGCLRALYFKIFYMFRILMKIAS